MPANQKQLERSKQGDDKEHTTTCSLYSWSTTIFFIVLINSLSLKPAVFILYSSSKKQHTNYYLFIVNLKLNSNCGSPKQSPLIVKPQTGPQPSFQAWTQPIWHIQAATRGWVPSTHSASKGRAEASWSIDVLVLDHLEDERWWESIFSLNSS